MDIYYQLLCDKLLKNIIDKTMLVGSLVNPFRFAK